MRGGRPALVEKRTTRHECLVCGHTWTRTETRFMRWASEEEDANWVWW